MYNEVGCREFNANNFCVSVCVKERECVRERGEREYNV